MTEYKQKLINIIRSDVITMSGEKNSMSSVLVMTMVFSVALEFLVSPLGGVIGVMMTGSFFIPALFHNELKYKSHKMWGLLPIERKDLVRSRFILIMMLYVAMGLILYLTALISLKVRLYEYILPENGDFLKEMAKTTDGMMTEFGLLNIYFAAFSAFGIRAMGSSLKQYFFNKESFSTSLDLGVMKRKMTGKEKRKLIFTVISALALTVAFVLIITGMWDISAVLSIVAGLLLQLAQAGNGFLLGFVLISEAVLNMIYKYIVTLVDYEKYEM